MQVFRKGKRTHWYTKFQTWIANPDDPRAVSTGKPGYWSLVERSTGIPVTQSKEAAEEVAAEMVRIGKALAPDVGFRRDRAWYQKLVEDLCTSAGLGDLVREVSWKTWTQTWLKSKEPYLKEESMYKPRRFVELWLKFLGSDAEMLVSNTLIDQCRDFHAWLLEEIGMKGNTAKTHIVYLKESLRDAQNEGYTSSNPAEAVKVGVPGETKNRKDPFTVAEVRRLLETANGTEWHLPVVLSIAYGLRLANSVSMRPDMIISTITGSKVFEFVPAKKADKIRLPITPEIQRVLDTIDAGDWYCPVLSQLKSSALSKRFIELMETAGVEQTWAKGTGKQRFSLKSHHSFRHFSKSHMRTIGIDDETANMLNNHDDEEVAKRYRHADMEILGGAASKTLQSLG